MGVARPVFDPWLDVGLPGSRFETESFSTMLRSVGFLVFEHDWRYSRGTRDGGCRTTGSLAWAVGVMGIGRVLGRADDGPAWRWGERGEWTDRDPEFPGTGTAEWLREEPSWVYACAVCGPFPEEGNIVYRAPDSDDNV